MTAFETQPPMLADGGIETDLIHHYGAELPEFAAFVLVDSQVGREMLTRYWDGYAELAERAGVGLQLETPTWRASCDWAQLVGYSTEDMRRVAFSSVALLAEVADRHREHVEPIVIGGVVGPRYEPDGPLMSVQQAREYHGQQVALLAEAGVDQITAMTLTNTPEAIGIVRACDDAGVPVVVSFTVETDGRLLDGSPLADAILEVDATAPPRGYMVNCAHTSHIARALDERAGAWQQRINGLRPNASALSHAEIDELESLDEGDPEQLSSELSQLRQRLVNVAVIGGCCGTDTRHIAQFWGL
jgi:homocysteine S-methyltransferase